MEALLAEARRRARRIDRYVDMIPARYYLSGEDAQALQASKKDQGKGKGKGKGKWRGGLDLALIKTTSQLVAEMAAASSAGAAGAESSGKGRRGKKRKAGQEGGEAPPQATSGTGARGDLVAKLNSRIAELKEERRRRQSESDKAKAAAKREAAGDAAPPSKVPRGPVDQGDSAAGRLHFDPKASDLPFEAGVNRKGTKAAKLRASLRATEAEQKRLEEAEKAGNREEVKKEIAMRKALARARGEKVHDDVQKLRKAQRTLEAEKRKSKQSWADRVQADTKEKADKQERRKENLKKQRAPKKKGTRVGFEGQKSGYLNKE